MLIIVTRLVSRLRSAGLLNDWGFARVDEERLRKVSEPKPPTPWPNTKPFQRGTEEDETLHRTASRKPACKPLLTVDFLQGSMTFMALHLMYNGQWSSQALTPPPRCFHQVHHDLESFFYVLVVVCVLFEGPGQHRSMEELEGSTLKSWWMPGSYRAAADFKASAFASGLPSFKRNITSYFTPYFQPLITAITDLFHTIFDNMIVDDPVGGPAAFNFEVVNTCSITYEVMLEKMQAILQAARAADQADQDNLSNNIPTTPLEAQLRSSSADHLDSASVSAMTPSFPQSSTDPLSNSSLRTFGSTSLLPDSPERYNLRLELAEVTNTKPGLVLQTSEDLAQYTPVIHLPIGIGFKLFTPSSDIPPSVYPDLIPQDPFVEERHSESGRVIKWARTSGSGKGRGASSGRSKKSGTSGRVRSRRASKKPDALHTGTILAFSELEAPCLF